MKIVVAVTAASGALYARLCLEQLLRAEEVSEIALVYSTHASEVADFEGVTMPEDPRIRIFDNDDLFAPPASGSADYDAMAVVPCSVGTLAGGAKQTSFSKNRMRGSYGLVTTSK